MIQAIYDLYIYIKSLTGTEFPFFFLFFFCRNTACTSVVYIFGSDSSHLDFKAILASRGKLFFSLLHFICSKFKAAGSQQRQTNSELQTGTLWLRRLSRWHGNTKRLIDKWGAGVQGRIRAAFRPHKNGGALNTLLSYWSVAHKAGGSLCGLPLSYSGT